MSFIQCEFKDGLPRYKTHWTFIQSNTRMLVKKIFWNVKRKVLNWLKIIYFAFCHMSNLVTTCICLHKSALPIWLAFIWIRVWKFKKNIKNNNSTFGNIKINNMFKLVEEAIKQMKRCVHSWLRYHYKNYDTLLSYVPSPETKSMLWNVKQWKGDMYV
jgi:hypothetical protein